MAATRRWLVILLCVPFLTGCVATSSRFDLKRVAIRESSTTSDMARYCTFDLGPEKARWMLLQMPRTVLGMERYSRLRRFVLNEKVGNSSELFRP